MKRLLCWLRGHKSGPCTLVGFRHNNAFIKTWRCERCGKEFCE